MHEQEDKGYGQASIEKNSGDEENECWASDSGSSTGSYYSDSTGSAIEWESEISPEGEVFYIESPTECPTEPIEGQVDDDNVAPIVRPIPELTRRRSTRANKLIRLIKRKESYRHSVRLGGLASELKQNQESLSKLYKEREAGRQSNTRGERYTVNLWIDPDTRHKLGRRATACEAYLGIIPQIHPLKSKITVAGFVPDGQALKNRDIKLGDWLQSINSEDVTCQNIERILSGLTSPCNAVCQFQRARPDGGYQQNLPAAISCPNSLLARQLVDKEESQILMDSFIKEPLGVICIALSEFAESESEMQGVLYSFPRSTNKHVQSFLITTKGAFVTLNHLLADISGSQSVVSTTVKTAHGLTHIVYFSYKEELLLIAIPEKCCSKQQAVELSNDIVCTLAFTNENVSKCFVKEENHLYLDHFFYLFFSRLYKDKIALTSKIDPEAKAGKNSDEIRQCDFNFMLPSVQSIQLPRDAQIQIDAALSEMEAMDYRDWNREPMECQRLYTILGSCLYHGKYLLGAHLPAEDLLQVHSYLRRHGLLNLVHVEPVKSVVIWKKIYPSSCASRKLEPDALIEQWFLLVVGYGRNLLAVVLESGGCTATLQERSGPDIFYVEEAQQTLRHLQKIGVPTLAEKWIVANAKPEVAVPPKQPTASKLSITDNIVGLVKTTQAKSASVSTLNSTSKAPNEASSTRGSEEARLDTNSGYPFDVSPDSPSQDSLSQVSEVSDQAAPILGRRATREQMSATTQSRPSDDSDSDFDADRVATSDIDNIRENLLNQAEYIVPKLITTGEKNSLLYYVHVDLFEGILISSKMSHLDNEFRANLNFCSQKIRKLLSDTKRYKKLLGQDTGKSVINKSLIAIKEHGVLFEWANNTYWVIGRLYSNPRPKELYVCYQESTPQNLIEMAFRLQATNY